MEGHLEVLKWAINNGAPWKQYRDDISYYVSGTVLEDWYSALSHD